MEFLIGKKLIGIRKLTATELDKLDWPIKKHVEAMEFEGDTIIFASQDGEGNGPGCLFGATKTANGEEDFYVQVAQAKVAK